MKQARLRFYERLICPLDTWLENTLIPILGVMLLIAFIHNISGGAS